MACSDPVMGYLPPQISCNGIATERTGQESGTTASNSVELTGPAYIQLRPTQSHQPCNLTFRQSGLFEGFLEQSGNCQGFIGSVILIDTENNQRQAANVAQPPYLTWRAAMKKIDVAQLILYSNVLPHELLEEATWVLDDAVLYSPTIKAVKATVIDEGKRPAHVAVSEQDMLPHDGVFSLWGNRTILDLPKEIDLSCYHSASYRKIWIIGTSESRRLFDHVCAAISSNPADIAALDKRTTHSQCKNVYFVNTCQWGCGCDFRPFFESEADLTGQFVSLSCGLHGEYLEGSHHLQTALYGVREWAQRLEGNQTQIQFRVSNAVNPFKTVPKKLTIARNNFRYQMFRDLVLSSFRGSQVHVMDAFRATEAVFDLSEDHVHFPPWVYGELARIFLYSFCFIKQ